MIGGLSKAINLYLAPLLSLTALILILFSYLAPTILFPAQVALLTVTPSLELTESKSSEGIDGPSVFLGALGTFLRLDPPEFSILILCKGPARVQTMMLP